MIEFEEEKILSEKMESKNKKVKYKAEYRAKKKIN